MTRSISEDDKVWFRKQLAKLNLESMEEKLAWLDKGKKYLVQQGHITSDDQWFSPTEIKEIFKEKI